MIGTIGNLGGFLGPWAIGHLRAASHGFEHGFEFTGAMMAVTGVVVLLAGRRIFGAGGVGGR